MGEASIASVLRIEGELVTLQVFQNTRGISTGDKVVFLGRQMQAIYGELSVRAALQRRRECRSMAGLRLIGESDQHRQPLLQSGEEDHPARAGPDQYPDDRRVQLPRQVAENPDLFCCRRALQRPFDADRQPDRRRRGDHRRDGARPSRTIRPSSTTPRSRAR